MRPPNILARVRVLEVAATRLQSVDAEKLRDAVAALFDVLEEHYPAEPWQLDAACNLTVDRSTAAQVEAAAERIKAGILTAKDQRCIDAMPADALAIFGMSGQRYLLAVAQVSAST